MTRQSRPPGLRRPTAALISLAVFVSACGAERSTEAWCNTLHTETARIYQNQQELAAAGESGGLLGMGLALDAMTNELAREYQQLFERLEEVAPDEVRADSAAMRDLWEEMNAVDEYELGDDGASSLFAAFDKAGELLDISMRMGPPQQRLERFAAAECGPRPAL